MNVDPFIDARAPEWTELDALIRSARRRPESLGTDGVLRLGRLYRGAAADLAYVRRRFPGHPVVARVEALVGRARPLVYRRDGQQFSVRTWATHGYWRRVRERPAFLLLAFAALFGPMLLSGYWAWRDPGAARGLAPAAYESVTEPRPEGLDLGIPVDEQAALSAEIFTNNIRVTAFAFAGGVLLGAGSLLILAFNGVQIGTIAGLAIGAGNGRPFFELVTAHGVLELSCIFVAGAAGMRIGWAIVAPGYEPRGVVLKREAAAAVEVLIGTSLWLVVAGLVEGFVTPAGLGFGPVMAIGWGIGAIYWGLVVVLGRRSRAERASRRASRRPARRELVPTGELVP